MGRDVTTAAENAFTADHVRWGFLFEGEFDSGVVYLWSGLGSLTYDGKTYLGAGTLGEVGPSRENVEMRADALEMKLSGIPSNLLSLALGEDYQGRSVVLRVAFFDDSGQVVSDAVTIFQGAADQMTIAEDGDTAEITLTVESPLAIFDRRSGRRYTSGGLKKEFTGDKGLEFVAGLSSKDIRWGVGKVDAPVRSNNYNEPNFGQGLK